MPQFVFTYRAPNSYAGSPDEVAKWRSWFEGLGEAVDVVGEPVFTRADVGECGPSTNLGGYSVISADSLADAAGLVEGCPIIDVGGGVVVGELTPTS